MAKKQWRDAIRCLQSEARNLYWKYLTHLYQMGFDAWWTDSTEPDHFEKPGDENYQTFDGSWLGVKNAFPLLHNKSIYEHQRAMKGNTKRSLQMTRSGSLGIQHYGTICWSGDVVASWDEMKNQIPSGLNFSLCGIPFWNTDLGGFFYWEFEQNPKNPAHSGIADPLDAVGNLHAIDAQPLFFTDGKRTV